MLDHSWCRIKYARDGFALCPTLYKEVNLQVPKKPNTRELCGNCHRWLRHPDEADLQGKYCDGGDDCIECIKLEKCPTKAWKYGEMYHEEFYCACSQLEPVWEKAKQESKVEVEKRDKEAEEKLAQKRADDTAAANLHTQLQVQARLSKTASHANMMRMIQEIEEYQSEPDPFNMVIDMVKKEDVDKKRKREESFTPRNSPAPKVLKLTATPKSLAQAIKEEIIDLDDEMDVEEFLPRSRPPPPPPKPRNFVPKHHWSTPTSDEVSEMMKAGRTFSKGQLEDFRRKFGMQVRAFDVLIAAVEADRRKPKTGPYCIWNIIFVDENEGLQRYSRDLDNAGLDDSCLDTICDTPEVLISTFNMSPT
jgi:hypothetical protein